MIIIRQEQMAVFAETSRREFERRALAYLAKAHPHEYEKRGEESARELVRRMTERTKPWGLDSEAGAVVCTELALVYGDEFYREPWALYVLHHTDLDPAGKIGRLRKYLDEEAEEAEEES
jgi:hypothetical protein